MNNISSVKIRRYIKISIQNPQENLKINRNKLNLLYLDFQCMIVINIENTEYTYNVFQCTMYTIKYLHRRQLYDESRNLDL